MILYLRASTRADMEAALAAAGIPVSGCRWCAVDMIGPILGPQSGPAGAEVFPVVDGRFHANIMFHGFDPPEQMLAALPVISAPSTPSRTFA